MLFPLRRFHFLSLAVILLSAATSRSDEPRPQATVLEDFPSREGWRPLFNGKDLSGWKFRNPRAKKVWKVCDDVRLDPADASRLSPVGGAAVRRPRCSAATTAAARTS